MYARKPICRFVELLFLILLTLQTLLQYSNWSLPHARRGHCTDVTLLHSPSALAMHLQGSVQFYCVYMTTGVQGMWHTTPVLQGYVTLPSSEFNSGKDSQDESQREVKVHKMRVSKRLRFTRWEANTLIGQHPLRTSSPLVFSREEYTCVHTYSDWMLHWLLAT